MRRVWAWLLTKLQDRCQHDPSHVTADIHEGEHGHQQVQWCRICGAYQFVQVIGPTAARALGWRRPRPLWSIE